MNWLTGLCAQIRNSGASQAQIDALVLRALEVATICEKLVPAAPPLQFGVMPDSGDGPELQLEWRLTRLGRTWAIVAQQDGRTYLSLYDEGRGSSIVFDPRTAPLKSSIASFFEGWVAP
jgi:hypothetical protein